MDDLKKLTSEEAARFEQLVAAFTPITTTETPDYAELYFGEHRTQAMTMQPQDWLDFGKLLPKAVAAVNALPELLAIKAERDRAQRACEQMGARITSLETELGRLREALGTLTDCQPVPKVYKYTGTAEVDVENMFDVGHRHRNGKQPRDYLMSWLSMFRPFAYATKDDSWGELEKLISIVMNNYVQILVRAAKARAALNQEPGQ